VTDAQFNKPDATSYRLKKVTFMPPAMNEATAEATSDTSGSEATPEPTAAG
jgi:hypothetical protein